MNTFCYEHFWMAVSALLSRIYGKDFTTLQQINSTWLNSTNAAYSLRISLLQWFSSAMPDSKSTVFRANSYRNHKRSLKIKFFNIVYCFHNSWKIIKPFFLVSNLKMLTFQKQCKQNRVDKWKWSIWCDFPIKSHCVKSVQIRSFFWSAFSRIRTECGEILWMRKNADQKKLRIWTLFMQGQYRKRTVGGCSTDIASSHFFRQSKV